MRLAGRAVAIAILGLGTGLLPSLGQGPDYSGMWAFDASRSRVTPEAGLRGLIPAGAPGVLHISQASNGTVSVESQINESHSRAYVPDRETSTPAGPNADIVMTASWDEDSLIAEGRIESRVGEPVPVREVFAISPDGQILTVTVTVSEEGQESQSRMVYERRTALESCEAWPTPCTPR